MLRSVMTMILGGAALAGAAVAYGKLERKKSHNGQQNLLDEALDETFPASDAISPSAGQLSHTEQKLREKAKNVA